jgi:UDP-2,3-diacylglucosamine hydrolase
MFDVLNAPPSWQCIDFVSDLHLHAGLPRTAQALADYLRNTPADAVLLVTTCATLASKPIAPLS